MVGVCRGPEAFDLHFSTIGSTLEHTSWVQMSNDVRAQLWDAQWLRMVKGVRSVT